MDEQIIRLLFIAAIAIFALIKQLRKGQKTEAPPPPRPRRPPRETGRAPGEPEEERIDLSFLQDAFESIGIELPEPEREIRDDFDELEPTPPPRPIPEPEPEPHPHPGHDPHPRRLAAAAYEEEPELFVPRPPRADAELVTVEEIAPFFADLDDYWDHETQTKRSGRAELLGDAVILDAILAPYKKMG